MGEWIFAKGWAKSSLCVLGAALLSLRCGGESADAAGAGGGSLSDGASGGAASGGRGAAGDPAQDGGGSGSESRGDDQIPVGNPDADGACERPDEADLEDISQPDTVIGDGTPESCTGPRVVEAVGRGGVIVFDCGPKPVTITMDEPAKVRNAANPVVTLDGGGKVTLDGGGKTRILYMNTCDEKQGYTTTHCDNQDHPRLAVQNLTFVDGNSKNEETYDGGGAVYARGGRLKIIRSRFFRNECASEGPDVGGAAVRAFQQFENRPAYVIESTFGGGPDQGNVCSNGGGISSIGVNWVIVDSLFSHNQAIGRGGNPAEAGTPGGGSGGGIYCDGGTLRLSLCGTRVEDNTVRAYGAGIFFVSNNHDGTLELSRSVIRGNRGGGWNVLPGISMHDDTVRIIDEQTIVEP